MFFKLLSRLPFPILYLLSDLLFLMAYYVVRYRRQIVYENIKRSFPEKSEKEIKTIAKQFYRNLADILMETLKSFTISPLAFKKRFSFTNADLVESYFNKKQSILVMAGHLGNWEWLFLGCCIYLSPSIGVIYKQLNNKKFNQLMIDSRSRFGGIPILMERALRTIVQREALLTGYGIVSDQVPHRDSDIYWTEFLHQETAFFTGTPKIALHTKYPIFFLSMAKIKRGYYEGTFHLLDEPPYEKNNFSVLDKYAKVLEEIIRKDPAAWLWSHRRWKYAKPS